MATHIVRSWTGVTAKTDVSSYLAHLRDETIPQLRALPGFLGLQVLQRSTADEEEFRVQTTWQSRASIHAFAGDDLEIAVVPPAAQAILKRFDDQVEHFEVVISCPQHDNLSS